jgi:transposase
VGYRLSAPSPAIAHELIFLEDGAEWIWNLVQEHYPEAVQIVDWFHATEYITPVANAALTTEIPPIP